MCDRDRDRRILTAIAARCARCAMMFRLVPAEEERDAFLSEGSYASHDRSFPAAGDSPTLAEIVPAAGFAIETVAGRCPRNPRELWGPYEMGIRYSSVTYGLNLVARARYIEVFVIGREPARIRSPESSPPSTPMAGSPSDIRTMMGRDPDDASPSTERRVRTSPSPSTESPPMASTAPVDIPAPHPGDSLRRGATIMEGAPRAFIDIRQRDGAALADSRVVVVEGPECCVSRLEAEVASMSFISEDAYSEVVAAGSEVEEIFRARGCTGVDVTSIADCKIAAEIDAAASELERAGHPVRPEDLPGLWVKLVEASSDNCERRSKWSASRIASMLRTSRRFANQFAPDPGWYLQILAIPFVAVQLRRLSNAGLVRSVERYGSSAMFSAKTRRFTTADDVTATCTGSYARHRFETASDRTEAGSGSFVDYAYDELLRVCLCWKFDGNARVASVIGDAVRALVDVCTAYGKTGSIGMEEAILIIRRYR